jgi:hypothetical protein
VVGFSGAAAHVERLAGRRAVADAPVDPVRGPSLHARDPTTGADNRHNHAMPYLRLIDEDEATGRLAEQYEAARRRAGKVFNVVKAMSLAPMTLDASMGLYREVMFKESELSRAERELLATVVSRVNDCHY